MNAMTTLDREHLWPLIQSEVDERLMLDTLSKCYSAGPLAYRVSAEHYRYLAEQIVALREHVKRLQKEPPS
jgi:hypothetical protein